MSMTQYTVTPDGIQEGNGYQPQAPVANQPIFQDTAKMKYEITAEGGFKSLEGGQYRLENQLQGSILSTARNNGNPVISADAVNDNTIVKINGMEMTAKSAASAGFLQKDSNGRYHDGKVNFQDRQDATGQAPADDSQTTTNENNINYELVDRNLEQSLDSIGNTIGFQALDSIALSSVAGLVNGDINHAAKNLAISMQTEHEDAKEFIQEAYTRLEAKSDRKSVV